ncbi:MAG: alpha/beta hydrolase [Chitinophagaceae bacterium]|nr:alpha/beta hydrolase [Chitinophagaceae bacterium]
MTQYNGAYARVNQLNIYYEIHGEGFPLVLIHGGGSTIGTTFGRVLPILAKSHKVIAVELQAHGHTADIDRELSFEQDADDVAALLKHLNIPKADILGFSNGGTTTLQIAIRHPELVNKIVVISTFYKKPGAPSWLWEFLKNGTFADMPQQLKDAFLEINPDEKALLAMHDRDLYRMQHFPDINESDIKSIKAKTLIVAGDRDVVTPEHAVEMSRQINDSRLLIVPDNHGGFIGEICSLKENTNQQYPVIDLIEQFLKE